MMSMACKAQTNVGRLACNTKSLIINHIVVEVVLEG